MDAGALYPMEYGTDTDVIFFNSSLKVLAGESADSPVIWKHDYSLDHAGWSMLYLYREYGADYLLEYSPYMNQGYGAYSLRVFYIGPDNKTVEVHSHTADFALQQEDRTGFFGDADALAAFMDTAENYIKNSLLLVSTDQGELAYSTPERPVTLDHDNSFFTDSWNATGKWDGQETIRYMSQKNWMETEGISRLCISRLSGDTVNVQLKNRNGPFFQTRNRRQALLTQYCLFTGGKAGMCLYHAIKRKRQQSSGQLLLSIILPTI